MNNLNRLKARWEEKNMFVGWKQVLFVFLALVLALCMLPKYADAHKRQSEKEIAPPHRVHTAEQRSVSGKADNGHDENPGEWYKGETPPNLQDDAPILLFVPGLNNIAQIFWEDNDMYQTAYEAGYQTAFIQLHDAGGESANMCDNGALIAEKTNDISYYLGGKPITIIAYSKGGVDAQTALAYYDAWEYVDRVITLSSPHHGTELADLAYSWWAGWLADLLGARGDGTYVLQTGNMEEFRSLTDQKAYAYYNDYYTFGGTGWASSSAATWFGGVYLSQYGTNDGVVTTKSSALPHSEESIIADWDHTSIRTGDAFSSFADYLTAESSQKTSTADEYTETEGHIPNQWVYGNEIAGDEKNVVTIPVEEKVEAATIHLLTDKPVERVKLFAPSGEDAVSNARMNKHEEGYFPQAYSQTITKTKPAAGKWELEVDAGEAEAYLLVVDYETSPKIKLHTNASQNNGRQQMFQLEAVDEKIAQSSLRTTYRIVEAQHPENREIFSANNKAALSQTIELEKEDTVYNIT